MDTNNKDQDKEKTAVVHTAILIVIISLLAIVALLATSHFDFVAFVIKLHGG